MKFITVIFLIAVCLTAILSLVSAMPQANVETQDVQEIPDDDFVIEEIPPPPRRSPMEFQRRKRISCDLLSGLGWGHSVCAAHCMTISWRYRGGYCNERGVCVCRS